MPRTCSRERMFPRYANRRRPPTRPRSIASSSWPGTAGPSNPAHTSAPDDSRVTVGAYLRAGSDRLRGRGDALARGAQRGRVALGEMASEERADRAHDVRRGVPERAPALGGQDDELAAPVALARPPLQIAPLHQT